MFVLHRAQYGTTLTASCGTLSPAYEWTKYRLKYVRNTTANKLVITNNAVSSTRRTKLSLSLVRTSTWLCTVDTLPPTERCHLRCCVIIQTNRLSSRTSAHSNSGTRTGEQCTQVSNAHRWDRIRAFSPPDVTLWLPLLKCQNLLTYSYPQITTN